MAWTQTDLDNIEAVLATGELTVRLSTGRMVTFQNTAELLKLRDAMRLEINSTSRTTRGPRHRLAVFGDEY